MNSATTNEQNAQAIETLAPWWESANLEPRYPATAADVVRLLAASEYVVRDDDLQRFAVGRVPDGQWSPVAILEFAAVLERFRRWQPESVLHDRKKHVSLLAKEQAEREGTIDEFRAALAGYSVEELILLIVEADDRDARETLHTALSAKCEAACR